MVTCEIEWNGVSCRDVGLHGVVVDGWPDFHLPEKDIEEYDVPGRDYPYLIDTGCYKSYTQKYTLHWRAVDAWAVAAWLSNPTGWCKLIDSRNPLKYRMAYYKGGFSVTDKVQVLGVATVEFECQPYFYNDQRVIDSVITTSSVFTQELTEDVAGKSVVVYPSIEVYGGVEWQTWQNPFKVMSGYRDAAGNVIYDHEVDIYIDGTITGGFINVNCQSREATCTSYDESETKAATVKLISGDTWCPIGLYNNHIYRFLKFDCDLGWMLQWSLGVDIIRRSLL